MCKAVKTRETFDDSQFPYFLIERLISPRQDCAVDGSPDGTRHEGLNHRSVLKSQHYLTTTQPIQGMQNPALGLDPDITWLKFRSTRSNRYSVAQISHSVTPPLVPNLRWLRLRPVADLFVLLRQNRTLPKQGSRTQVTFRTNAAAHNPTPVFLH